jgi:hypothetical protein
VKKVWKLEVTWVDSQVQLGGWRDIRKWLKRRGKGVRCHSVGYVLADDSRGVVLAGSVNGSNALGMVTIPARQIVKRKRLR